MMSAKNCKQAVSDLSLIFSGKDMLQRLYISKKNLLSLFKNERFLASLAEIFPVRRRYSCNELLNACRPILNELFPEPEGGWLAYTYRYAIGLNYPDREDTSSGRKNDCPLILLSLMRLTFENERLNLPFDPALDFDFLTESETAAFACHDEYSRFVSEWRLDFVYEMMRLGMEVTPFRTLEHIAGVHHIALTVSRSLAAAGTPVDLALVSGAAAGHDLGKFGCRAGERVPYLHYYYTDRWFSARRIPAIGHIAANHSTWDLELENLSAESLALIYADFRVKQERGENGEEITKIYSLSDAFDVILQKLDNVDEAKRRRYRFVYSKLVDFESYMRTKGVDTELGGGLLPTEKPIDTALMTPEQAVDAITLLAVEHNLALMNRLANERRFGNIIEAARSEKNWKKLRAYISIFDEYFTYLSAGQKIETLGFLYELLMHREGDIRRQAGTLIGKIIAKFNMDYHKELPTDADRSAEPEHFSLWSQYINMILCPDHKLTPQHKSFISYTLKIVVESVLQHCDKADSRRYFETLLKYYERPETLDNDSAFYLLDTLLYLPISLSTESELMMICRFAKKFADDGSIEMQLAALRFLKLLSESFPADAPYCVMAGEIALTFDCKNNMTLTFLQCRILMNLGLDAAAQQDILYGHDIVSDIFLDNLKTATPWITKAVNIELLADQIERGHTDHILHISAHLSNLIKVGERVVVRHSAGRALIKIAPLLSLDQRNEITVELLKGLEVGEYEVSKYIPEYLGEISLFLHPDELDEVISRLNRLLGSSNDRIVSVALNTVGRLIECYPEYRGRFPESENEFERRRRSLAGMLLKGLAGYRETVRQEALLVFGRYIFGSDRLSHADKSHLFALCIKKALFLMNDTADDELTFFYRAAALSQVYRFITLQRLDHGDFSFEHRKRAAFFPGTFDPFTLSHKGIVRAIRDLGFEVFLAVDEFSWSKKTQPHLIRRQIVSMSVADEFNVNLFPDDIPVNIANPADLKRLHEVFSGYELYIAVGSDVVANASSYRNRAENYSIHSMNHIVFRRESGQEGSNAARDDDLSMITGDIIRLSLPCHLEDISSTRIRENIDLNRDISNLIDPVAQEFIYHNSLYLREPQYKATLRPQDIGFEYAEAPTAELLGQIREFLSSERPNSDSITAAVSRFPDRLMIMRDMRRRSSVIGFIRFCETGSSELMRILGSAERADRIRRSANGRILIIRGIYSRRSDKSFDYAQLLFTEVLAKALADDCGFALFFSENSEPDDDIRQLLLRQGFSRLEEESGSAALYTVDMRSPLVLIQNLETTIKEPFASNEKVLFAVRAAHHRLQMAMTGLYPQSLVLSLSSAMIHHRLLGKITAINRVPETPTVPRVLGKYMCVPFGKILRGKVVPNTVTKTLHTDKVFEADLSKNSIEAFPYYTPLQSQIRAIHSFNRAVILVDDIMHSGDRWNVLSPLIKQEGVEVKTILVGLLSGRGRDLMETQRQSVDSVYYLPNMNRWFVESTLYPFIGGDTVRREKWPVSGLQPAINMILPYASSKMLSGCPKKAVYEFSRCCIENSHDILMTLEAQYREHFARNLTLSRLSEAVILPLCPDKGSCMSYDPNLAASIYLENDLQMLDRIHNQMT